MYVGQQLEPLLPRDASKRNIIGPFAVWLTILDAEHGGMASHTLGILLFLRQGPLK